MSIHVTEWTNVVKNQGQKYGYKYFIDQVMAIVYILIHNESPPRIFQMQKCFTTGTTSEGWRLVYF
jgi:hypothetical protein